MLVALAALIAAAPAAAQSPLGLRPEGSTFRVVVIPIQIAGKRAPSAPKLRRMLDRASRWYAKASYDRMRLEGAIAPTFVAGRSRGGCSERTSARSSRSSIGPPRAACRSTARCRSTSARA